MFRARSFSCFQNVFLFGLLLGCIKNRIFSLCYGGFRKVSVVVLRRLFFAFYDLHVFSRLESLADSSVANRKPFVWQALECPGESSRKTRNWTLSRLWLEFLEIFLSFSNAQIWSMYIPKCDLIYFKTKVIFS